MADNQYTITLFLLNNIMDDFYNIKNLKGIGEKTAGLYNKLGIFSYEDLLYYFPRDYIRFDKASDAIDIKSGEICSIKAFVVKRPLMRKSGRLQIVSAYLKSGEIIIDAVWFHMPYLTKALHVGEEYIFRGAVTVKGDKYHLEQPVIYTVSKYEELLDTLQPVYPLTKGVTNASITKSVKTLMEDPHYGEMKIRCLRDKYEETKSAIEEIHFPKSFESLVKARKYLVYDEFFLFVLRLRLLKGENERSKNDFEIYPSAHVSRLIEKLPYSLTNAQKKVFAEIENDLMSKTSMSRLVQGDVGSGKTIIAVLSAIMVGVSGYQTALMAPTEILATQHYESVSQMLKQYNIPLKAILLTGSKTAKEKREIYEQIRTGDVNIVIGTHALIQEKVEYKSLALVITDEQHRFGVKQREMLSLKNKDSVPHILVMSATPIPRTLAIIMYGDLDISVIDEVPARRLPIKNCVVDTNYRNTAYKFMQKELDAGHQVYVICPLVEESEGLEAEDVINYTEKLKAVFPPSVSIAYLHGKMKQNEKDRVMNAFYNNDIHILVSTTVVEVGVNVPNATVMLIENSERFGLSQLHQLRGRIGRGDKQSYCIFMSSKQNKTIMERLETLNKSNDGFFIASEDMRLRGPGDLFGLRQSGEMQFKLGDVFNDANILKAAADDVTKLLEDDPKLEKIENRYIRNIVVESFSDDLLTTI